MLAKRRKKDRGSTERLTENRSENSARGFKEHKAPQRLVEDFGLFVRKALTAVSEKASRGDTNLCSHKQISVTYILNCFTGLIAEPSGVEITRPRAKKPRES